MEQSGFRPAIADADLDQQVFRFCLGVFNKHIEVPVVVKYAGIQQFILQLLSTALVVGFNEVPVWKGRLGILVQVLHVGVGRRTIEVEIVLLHILTMIPLGIAQSEGTFLQDRVLAVPERKSKAENLMVI